MRFMKLGLFVFNRIHHKKIVCSELDIFSIFEENEAMIFEDFKSYFPYLEEESNRNLFGELLELSDSSNGFSKEEECPSVSYSRC